MCCFSSFILPHYYQIVFVVVEYINEGDSKVFQSRVVWYDGHEIFLLNIFLKVWAFWYGIGVLSKYIFLNFELRVLICYEYLTRFIKCLRNFVDGIFQIYSYMLCRLFQSIIAVCMKLWHSSNICFKMLGSSLLQSVILCFFAAHLHGSVILHLLCLNYLRQQVIHIKGHGY